MVTDIERSAKRQLESHDEDDHSNKKVKIDNEEVSDDPEEASQPQVDTAKVTAKDMQVAKETAELFKSNIFKLQIDELVKNVQLPEKHILKMEKFLHKLYDLLQDLPDWGSEKTLEEIQEFFHDKTTSIPFADPKPIPGNTNYKFGFLKPSKVSLIGSFALKSAIHEPEGSSIDVSLEMPESLIEKKDFLNYRIIHKRAVYVAFMTHFINISLEKSGLSEFIKLSYSYKNNDILQPVLKISSIKLDNPKNDKLNKDFNFYKSKFTINILVTYPENVFDSKKLGPARNAIRLSKDSAEPVPTPLYNFFILSNTYQNHYLKYLHRIKKNTESFKEAMVLARIWLKQRGFSSDVGSGFGAFEFSILMASLLHGGGLTGNKILLHGFSSYQLFKTTIKYIVDNDFNEDGYLQINTDFDETDKSIMSTKYHQENDEFEQPTILDKYTKINILGKMTSQSYKSLKLHAKNTLIGLNDQVKDQFEAIFLSNLNKNQLLKYDMIVDVDISQCLMTLNEKFTPLAKITNLSFENFLVSYINEVVEKSLDERVQNFEVELLGMNKKVFDITRRKINYKNSSFRLKLVLDLEESEKLVTKGPKKDDATDKTEIAEFKKHWGNKVSLRRFKDGSIVYSCVWTGSSSNSVVFNILEYILPQHLGSNLKIINANDIKVVANHLKLPNVPGAKSQTVTNLSNFFKVKKSFDELHKIIFAMTDLPLAVRNIQPIGNAFRYTSLLQPVPFAYSNPEFLQDVILEFESTSKWPDEISALEKAKAAFMLKIHDNLVKDNSEYKVSFARDERIPYNLEVITMDIFTPEGFGFKFRVLTERDEILYLRAIDNCRNDLKKELENTFLKFIQLYKNSVLHTRTIETLSHSYPMYAPTCRLFKQWLDSHLLLTHFPEELIELIVMQPFVDQGAYNAPGSVQNGFLKVIKFLSKWNWLEEPLILDLIKPEEFDKINENKKSEDDDLETENEISEFNLKKLSEKLTITQYKEFQTNFEETRRSNPTGLNFQFFVASRVDPTGILYSSDINLSIATRLTALSKIAMNLISQHGLNERTMKLLFTPGLKDYDFVVNVKIPKNFYSSSGILKSFKNVDDMITKFPEEVSEMSGLMDPTYHLVKYLNKKYGTHMIFSYQKFIALNGKNAGGEGNDSYNVITGLIKPLFKSGASTKFRINLDADVKPVDDVNVQLNIDAILSEICTFGFDIIDSVVKN